MQASLPAPAPEERAPDAPLFWTVKDVAVRLQCSESKVYQLQHLGQLPSFKIGALLRFLPAAIEAWALEVASGGGVPLAHEIQARKARRARRAALKAKRERA